MSTDHLHQLESLIESVVEETILENNIQSLEQYIRNLYDVKLNLFQRGDTIRLAKIVVPKERRGEGIGDEILEIIKEFADENDFRITLTPDSSLGGNRAKLIKWYKRHGFIENRGKNKDYEISDAMYRDPR